MLSCIHPIIQQGIAVGDKCTLALRVARGSLPSDSRDTFSKRNFLKSMDLLVEEFPSFTNGITLGDVFQHTCDQLESRNG